MGLGATAMGKVGAPTPADAGTKLEIAELFLACDRPGDCAQAAVDWLGQHLGTPRALCAVLDDEGTRLVGIAGQGVPRAQVRELSLDLQGSHPLVEALRARRPVTFGGAAAGVALFGDHPFVALPLQPTVTRGMAVGLLLTNPVPARIAREVRWIADLLAEQLARLRKLRLLLDAERRLGRERALIDRIMDAVADPILLTDVEGRVLRANARARGLFAAGEGESEGRRRAVALNNMLLSAALSQLAIDGDACARRELLLVDPSEGSDLLFELMTTVARDERAGTGLVSILRNVTDLRRASEELEENLRRLRTTEAHMRAERDRLDLIIDSVVDPILVTDPMGNIVLLNPPAERLFTTTDARGDLALRAVRANDAQFSSFVSNLFFAGGEELRRGEIELQDPGSGGPVPVEAIAGKILSERGEVAGVVTILHDRTEAIERARLYEELKRASDQLELKVREATAEVVRRNELLQRQHMELEKASALKSQFLASVSHEFRTPLNAILGYTSLLLKGVSGTLTAPQARSLGRVEANGQHLLAIINDLLDIARIEAGKMPLHTARFALPALIAEVMAEIEPIIDRSRLEVATRLPRTLPALRSDRQKVKQIALNLVTNALKFTPRGSVTVSATYDRRADEVSLAVVDTGVGIDPAAQAGLFEDFHQAEDAGPRREYGSTGLGLSICRRLAAILGGRIGLVSEPGRGSTFTLVLPRTVRRPGGGP